MAFSGGTYTLPAGNPVTTGTTIQSSWANTTLSDIATALSTCVLKDGSQTITANIPMNSFKFTGLANGSAATDSVAVGQLQNNTVSYLTGTAGTNTITASATPTLTVLTAGQVFRFIPANTNTGATTLQINSTTATNVFWNGAALVGGEIRQNVPVEVFYDGTQYQLIGSAAMANTYAVPDNAFRLQAAGDRTKMFLVAVTNVPTATLVTMFAPGTGGATIVGDTLAQTLTNKTFTSPTFDSPTVNTLITGTAIANQTVMTSGTSVNTIVTPGNLKYSDNAIKAWGVTSGTLTTVGKSYPSGATITKNSTGNYTIKHGATFDSNVYYFNAAATDSTGSMFPTKNVSLTTTGATILIYVIGSGGTSLIPADPDTAISWTAIGRLP